MYWRASVVHHVHSVVLEHYNRRTSVIVNRGLVALTFVFLFRRSIQARETYITSSLVGEIFASSFLPQAGVGTGASSSTYWDRIRTKSRDVTSRDL